MSSDFTIPFSREELLRSNGKGSYNVTEVLSINEIICRIDDCQSSFADEGPSAIGESFDVIYAVMHHFPSVSQSVRESYWNMIMEALTDSCRLFDSEIIEKQKKRNSLKMLVYSVAQFVDLFENQVCKPGSINMVKKTRKGKKSGLSASGGNRDEGCGSMWEEERDRALVVLYQLFQQDLTQIFDPPACEGLEDIVNLTSGCCYKILENPAAMRDKELKDSISNLLGLIVKTYHQSLGVSVKMVQLLQHFEHLVQPLAQAVQLMVTKYSLNNFVAEIIREVGEKDPQDLAIDSSGTKSYAAFISELASVLPSQSRAGVTYLIPHLNGESQTMRNGVLAAFGEVVCQSLSGPELDGETRNLRDTLLDYLQDHIHDVSAFVRCKVLQVWLRLCQAKCIPLPRLKELLRLVCGRLGDKSSLVRKSSLQLLTGFLKNNPFAAQLDLEHFKSLLVVESEKLRALLPPEDKNNTATERDNSGTQEEQEGHDPQDGEANEEEEEMGRDSGDHEDETHKVEVVKQMGKVQYFKDSVSFIEQIISSIPLSTQLLGSKVSSDVHEALEFLATAQEFKLPGAKEGVRKSLLLMSSSGQAIRELVMNVYVRLYFTPSGQSSPNVTIAQNILSLVHGASIGELASLEEMLLSLMKTGRLPKLVVRVFWDVFAGKVPWGKPEDVKYSLMVLSMMAKADGGVIRQNLSLLIEHGISPADLITARYSCQALHCLADRKTQTRFPVSHPLFSRLSQTMVSTVAYSHSAHWIPFAEQAVVTIYKLAENPDSIIEKLLVDLCDKTYSEQSDISSSGEDGPFVLLSRLISVAGHVALQQMVFLEADVRNELKRRRKAREDEEEGTERTAKQKEETNIEDEMGLAGVAADDMEAEVIRRVCTEEVCGRGMLGSILPVIITVLSKPQQYRSDQLQTSAALSLSKYMVVSSQVCEQYLRLFFTLLETSPISTVRANALITLGDLIVRFPNLIEPWTKNIYARLCDSDSEVRQSAVTVLTHLILNDMVKVKGQLSEMALCLEDPVHRITDRVKLFFMELSRKGNALYNILPDIISRLSDPSNNVSKEKFRNIMSYLFSLIQKDKQCEGLIEKLCHRFRASRTELQGQNLSFCLSQLSFSERGLRKLQENMACYQSLLTDPDVYDSFLMIVGKLRRFAKPEVKVVVEEFEARLKEAHEKGTQSEEDTELGRETIEEQERGEAPPTQGVFPALPGNQENQENTLVTPAPRKAKTTRRNGTTTQKKTQAKRKPLLEPNTPHTESSDFLLNAVSSARRSRQKIWHVSDNQEDEIDFSATPDVTRKVGKRRPRVLTDEN